MILFVLALLIPFVIVAENNNAYPFEIMQDKGYAIFDITKSNEYLHRLYCRWSPVLSDAAKIYGKDAADAGAFLLGHCQKDSKTCFSALEVILKLEERLVENDIESSALITNFIKDDIAHNLNGNTAPLERLKELGISPKKYSWNSLEGWLMPQLAKILHDTSKVLGQHALTKEAGSYFLTAYQQSVHDGDNAYSYMKHLKALIKKHPESDELQEYKKCLQEWHNTHISHS